MKLSFSLLLLGLSMTPTTFAADNRICGGSSQTDLLGLCTDGVQFADGHSAQDLQCKKISRWSTKRRSWLIAKKPAKQWHGVADGREATLEHVVTVGSACRMIFKYKINSVAKANGRDLPEETGHLVGLVHNNVFVGHIEQDNFDRRGVFSLLLDDNGKVFTGSVHMAKPGRSKLGKPANWTAERM